MKFTLEIELGNEAMQTFQDVLSAVQWYADRIGAPNAGLQDGNYGILRDFNGNKVGKWQVTA